MGLPLAAGGGAPARCMARGHSTRRSAAPRSKCAGGYVVSKRGCRAEAHGQNMMLWLLAHAWTFRAISADLVYTPYSPRSPCPVGCPGRCPAGTEEVEEVSYFSGRVSYGCYDSDRTCVDDADFFLTPPNCVDSDFAFELEYGLTCEAAVEALGCETNASLIQYIFNVSAASQRFGLLPPDFGTPRADRPISSFCSATCDACEPWTCSMFTPGAESNNRNRFLFGDECSWSNATGVTASEACPVACETCGMVPACGWSDCRVFEAEGVCTELVRVMCEHGSECPWFPSCASLLAPGCQIVPDCDQDGSFAALQCESEHWGGTRGDTRMNRRICWCALANGTEIDGTRFDRDGYMGSPSFDHGILQHQIPTNKQKHNMTQMGFARLLALRHRPAKTGGDCRGILSMLGATWLSKRWLALTRWTCARLKVVMHSVKVDVELSFSRSTPSVPASHFHKWIATVTNGR